MDKTPTAAQPTSETAPYRPDERPASYSVPSGHRIKRLWLGAFLGAITAVLAVAFVALVFATVVWAIGELILGQGTLDSSFDGNPLVLGAAGAILASIMNWYVFFITIPIATLVLRFSLGRLPGKGVTRAVPYLRWGSIWGAVLVSFPSMLGGMLLFGIGTTGRSGGNGGDTLQVFAGAAMTGAVIGAIAGLGVAGMFMLIVRPRSQIKLADPASAF